MSGRDTWRFNDLKVERSPKRLPGGRVLTTYDFARGHDKSVVVQAYRQPDGAIVIERMLTVVK